MEPLEFRCPKALHERWPTILHDVGLISELDAVEAIWKICFPRSRRNWRIPFRVHQPSGDLYYSIYEIGNRDLVELLERVLIASGCAPSHPQIVLDEFIAQIPRIIAASWPKLLATMINDAASIQNCVGCDYICGRIVGKGFEFTIHTGPTVDGDTLTECAFLALRRMPIWIGNNAARELRLTSRILDYFRDLGATVMFESNRLAQKSAGTS